MHHANLLVGTLEEAESYLCLLCDKWNIGLPNNPDFFAFRAETFGIDEARELKLLSARKALTSKKIFFIAPARLTLEAQNALLKTFEDPSPNTFFFLVVREEETIVPTLRSRMRINRMPGNALSRFVAAERFIASSVKDRLLSAKDFAEQGERLPVFLDELLLALRKQGRDKEVLKKAYRIRHCMFDYAVAPRLALEHLALVL